MPTQTPTTVGLRAFEASASGRGLGLARSPTKLELRKSMYSTAAGGAEKCPFSSATGAPGAGAEGQKLPPFTEVGGPSMQEYFGGIMADPTGYHKVLTHFMDQFATPAKDSSTGITRGLMKVPSQVNQGSFDLVVSDPDVIASIYQRPEFYDRPTNWFFFYAYTRLAHPDASDEQVMKWAASRGLEGPQGLVTANGARWEVRRRIANKALLAPAAVTRFGNQINDTAVKLTETLKELRRSSKDGTISLIPPMTEYTSQVILSVAFGGGSGDSKEHAKIRRIVESFFNCAKDYFFQPWPFPPSPQLDDLVVRLSELRETVAGFLKESRARVEAGEPATDFSSILYTTRDEVTGEYLQPHEVLSDTLDIINGGTDTTAALISFSLHLLAHHPEVADALYREVMAAAKTTQTGVGVGRMDANLLAKLPVLNAVIKETLRLYPSAPLGGRLSNKEATLGGYTFPANHTVVVNNWHVQRSPELWDSPLEFRPERWLIEDKKPHPFSWVPFGAGARVCIGQRLALNETRVALAHIISQFEPLPAPEELGKPYPHVDCLYRITLHPINDLRVALEPRQPSHDHHHCSDPTHHH